LPFGAQVQVFADAWRGHARVDPETSAAVLRGDAHAVLVEAQADLHVGKWQGADDLIVLAHAKLEIGKLAANGWGN
jgi:hypothetical protein